MQDKQVVNKPTFFEEEHKYKNLVTGQDYISVTTLLHKYVPEKDWSSIAKKYIKSRTEEVLISDLLSKYVISKESLLDKFKQNGKENTVRELWLEANKEACLKGTEYHKEKENIDLIENDCKKAPIEIEDLYLLPDGTYLELLIWNDFLGIAGLADKIIIETVGDTRYIEVEDYKTNKEIKDYNYLDKNGKKVYNDFLLDPVAKYCNCNYWLYQLQLNLYGWLLVQKGFKLRRGKIIHVTDNDKAYPLLNLQSDIDNIITHYQNERRNSKSLSNKK